ncbi:MAG: exodeoxyribonuclease VII small subunit [Magnetococcales bacterium]|jgi:exodeoxyribonuclease VII small subunit|nr:exodeoxyribonuclease VII small subunit [Magnetococcales bacterium]|tara:strand:+ start:641852 stop:642097 length:246 start_codon:yes stop_codon:yes gene_type:complete
MAEKTTETFKFEQAMADLETVVNKLEKGDMPLDDALDAFDKGVKLVKKCQDKLSEAELRVEKVLADANGKAAGTESFSTDA